MKLWHFDSVTDLRRLAAAWDDLWWRSDSYLPTHRAELLAQWLEHFAPGRRFVALAVEDDGQLVAALPLVDHRKGGCLPVGALTSNCWSDSGGLLLDGQAPPAAISLLASALRSLPWRLVSLDGVHLEQPAWQMLRDAIHQHRGATHTVPQFHVGLVDITHDWNAYVAALSGNHRRAIKRSLKHLQQEGDVQLRQLTELPAERIETLWRQACEIEDRSWKGEAGTSILRTPGMFAFFLRQAHQLAQWGQVELLFLVLNDEPIAFDYCYFAKGVIASRKIGYDPRFKQYGPGRLLRYLQLESYFHDPGRQLLDTLGIMFEANARWCTRSYPASRLMLATDRLGSKAILTAHARLWPKLRRVLRPSAGVYTPPKLGAAAAAATANQDTAPRLLAESV